MAEVMQTQPTAQTTQPAPATGMPNKAMPGQEKKSSKLLMWLLVILVVVVLGIGLWFWVF